MVAVETARLRGLGSETVAYSGSVNPYAASRATIDAATGAFTTARADALKVLQPAGTQLFEEAPEYWKIIQYPETLYACTPENMRKVTFQPGIWFVAQQNLAQLFAASKAAPFTTQLPAVGSPERRYCAALIADWYIAVMSWVSLAAYASNIQPAFLCPDSATTLVGTGLIAPTRTPGDGLPAELETLRKEIKGLSFATPAKPGNEFAAGWLDKGFWGPMWMGFNDRAEATGWLRGDFTPNKDPAAISLQQGNGGINMIWANRASRPLPAGVTSHQVRDQITDPWYQIYYSMLWFDFGDLLADWRQNDTTGRDSVSTRWLLGPQSYLRIGQTWAKWVMGQTLMDVILASSSWYSTNYLAYWADKGLGGVPIEQAQAAQRTLAAQKLAAKQAVVNQTVGTVMSIGGTIAVAVSAAPIVGPIAAGCTMLVCGITALILKRRRKKRVTVPVMQPLMLRSLSDGECNYFPPGTTLEASLTKLLTQVQQQATDLDNSAIVPSLGPGDPLNDPNTPVTTSLTTSPTAPKLVSVAPVPPTTGINTSNSNVLPPTPVVPSLQHMEAGAVQASQTPPTTSDVAATPGQVPWGVIGIGAAVAAVIFLRRG